MLILALKNSDHDAFHHFYDDWYKRVYSYFVLKTKTSDLAKELTQETFIRFWKFRESLSVEISLEAQLFQNARMVYIDELRRESKVKKHFEDVDLSNLQIFNGEDFAGHLENQDMVRFYLSQLPPVRKKVFVLYRIYGYSYKEIASELSISTKTVENHLSKALKQLRSVSTTILFLITYFLT